MWRQWSPPIGLRWQTFPTLIYPRPLTQRWQKNPTRDFTGSYCPRRNFFFFFLAQNFYILGMWCFFHWTVMVLTYVNVIFSIFYTLLTIITLYSCHMTSDFFFTLLHLLWKKLCVLSFTIGLYTRNVIHLVSVVVLTWIKKRSQQILTVECEWKINTDKCNQSVKVKSCYTALVLYITAWVNNNIGIKNKPHGD